MASTAAYILLDTIHDWGVEVIFGLPGDGINGIIEGLRKREKQIRFIQVRHEEQSLARGEPNRSKIAWTVYIGAPIELVR